MRYPATKWQDALPTGSGIVGALLYGNIKEDTLLLNHDGLFYPSAKPEVVDVSGSLPEVRKLISEGNSKDAANLFRQSYWDGLKNEPEKNHGGEGDAPYQPFCSLYLSPVTDGPFHGYRRGLDFETGKAWVRWEDSDNTFTREVFVSRKTDVVHARLSSEKAGALNVCLNLGPVISEQGDEKNICHSSFRNTEPDSKLGILESGDVMTFQATYPNGYQYGAFAKVRIKGGRLEVEGDTLVVKEADEIEIEISLYLDDDPVSAELKWKEESRTRDGFDVAFAEHVREHQELFNRVSLNIGEEEDFSNEEGLLKAYDNEISPAFIKKMFDYGRYLLLTSSRTGGQPSNLQGIWNGDYAPAWNCDVHTDENVQMNYWQALPAGMPETTLCFFEYFESFMDDFRENARVNYGCRGIMVPLAMTRHGMVNPPNYGTWTGAAGWIGQHFYDYWLFTRDREFLAERAIPWLREVALFYEDFLQEDEGGELSYSPSLSPENRPSNLNSMLTINSTMDIALCREVFSNLIEGCGVLGIDSEGVERWQNLLARLPAYGVNEDGAIREWIDTRYDDNYHHRHQCHLYPVFPGLEITEEGAPELFEACKVAVDKRLVIGLNSQTGWSMAHMANIYARLGMGERSLECLEILLRSSTGANFFTYHNDWRHMGLSSGGRTMPPFQIDANMGFSSAVLEMLGYSRVGQLKLLPALPESWTRGSIKGLRARGGLVVNMSWDRQQGRLELEVTTDEDQELELFWPSWVKSVDLKSGGLIQGEKSNSGILKFNKG